MIYQLPNGRIIELSVEQFLELEDVEVKELNGLSSIYSHECSNPFYDLFSNGSNTDKLIGQDLLTDDEFEPDLFDVLSIDPGERLKKDGFLSDDT
tara:strand:- start:215 stop:499 length:285 start_codon:yes stop_codon:yes gene_type:complete